MIDEVDKELFVWVFDETVEQPFVEADEVNLTACFEAFDEEALDIMVEDCRVFFVEEAEKVRTGGKFATVRRLRMNH